MPYDLSYMFVLLLFSTRNAVSVCSNDKYLWRHVTFLWLRWSGVSDDWRNPEMDELEIGQVLLCTAYRLHSIWYK